MINRTYTSVEQSRRLLELGLDKNTADMVYLKHATSDNLTPRFEGAAPMVLMDIPINEIDCDTLPCWSVGALLELMPPYLGEFDDGIDFELSKAVSNKWFSAHYIKIEENGKMKPVCVKTGNTSIDACFEMVCWLFENGHIKKGD